MADIAVTSSETKLDKQYNDMPLLLITQPVSFTGTRVLDSSKIYLYSQRIIKLTTMADRHTFINDSVPLKHTVHIDTL